MKENTRTKNALLNISFGYLALFGLKILAFFVRKIFLQYLSVEYLGINEIYTSILAILSLPKLAVDSVAIYMLYEPLSNKDNKTSLSLIAQFNKIYAILALCTLIIGIILIPFLHILVSSTLPIKDIRYFFLIYLINTIIPYFTASKVDLLLAHQEQRIQTIVAFITTFILHIATIFILKNCANYYYYLLAMLFTTILSNILINKTCVKIHKEIFATENKSKLETKTIINKVKDTLLYRLSNTIIDSSDTIIISMLVNAVSVGIYSNYCALIISVQEFIIIVITSLTSGIGNLMVKEDREKQNEVFNTILLIFHLIGALGFIGFSLLLNNCIILWLGKEYLLDSLTVFVIALNFYISSVITPINMFREANGLFGKVKYLLMIRAIVNVVLSIIFGKLWGIFGVLFATTISCILTNFWYEPRILFNNVIFIPKSQYWKKQIKYIITTILSFVICYFVVGYIKDQSILYFVLKIVLVIVIVATMFIITSLKTNEQKRIIKLIQKHK